MSAVVIAAVLFSAMLHAGWNSLIRGSSTPVWTVAWIGVSTFVVCAPFLPFVGIPVLAWPYILTSAMLRVISISLLVQAYKVNELSFAYPIARGSSPVIVTIGGMLIASEKLGIVQIVGITTIVCGMVAIGFDSKNWDKTGVYLALCSGIVIAAYTLIDGLGARRSGLPTQYNLWCFSIYGCILLIIQLVKNGSKSLAGHKRDILIACAGGMMCVMAYAIVTRVMVHSALGLVAALRETSTIFAGVFGLLFLREKFSVKRILGCVAIAGGAIAIGLG